MDMVPSFFFCFVELDTAALPMFVLEILLSENKEMIGWMCGSNTENHVHEYKYMLAMHIHS
jgi:hypothetical protein